MRIDKIKNFFRQTNLIFNNFNGDQNIYVTYNLRIIW